MSTADFNLLFKIFVENNWVGMECYNAFIKGFGAQFDKFESSQLIDFVSNLQRAGLNQKDIVSAVAERINELELGDRSRESIYVSFNSQLLKFLTAAVELDIQKDENVTALVKDEFIKKVFGEDQTITSMVNSSAGLGFDAQVQLLQGLIAREDLGQDNEYHDLARALADKIQTRSKQSERENLLNMTATRLYLIEKFLTTNGKEIFGGDFDFKLDDSYREEMDSVQDNDKFLVKKRDIVVGNQYYNNENVERVLREMGHEDVVSGSYVEGLPIKFWMPESNTGIIVVNSKGLLFDNKTLRGQLELIKKCAETSPSKMKVLVLNAREVLKKNDSALGAYLENIGIERKGSGATTEATEGASE